MFLATKFKAICFTIIISKWVFSVLWDFIRVLRYPYSPYWNEKKSVKAGLLSISVKYHIKKMLLDYMIICLLRLTSEKFTDKGKFTTTVRMFALILRTTRGFLLPYQPGWLSG